MFASGQKRPSHYHSMRRALIRLRLDAFLQAEHVPGKVKRAANQDALGAGLVGCRCALARWRRRRRSRPRGRPRARFRPASRGACGASCAPGIGTVTTWPTRPRKADRNPAGVLESHHADDKMQRLRRPLLEVGHGLRQRAAGGGIVAAVEPQLGAGLQQRRHRTRVQPLHAGRPARRGQSLLDGAFAQARCGRPAASCSAAATAVPALTIWWRPMSAGSGRSSSSSSSCTTRRPRCS